MLSKRAGGMPTMRGEQPRSESLCYYFRVEDQIPQDHLLRVIDEQIDLSFVRERVKGLYSATGRPSIDPEVLLRLLLLGYLYGIISERRLLEEVRMHLAYRWFTRLDFEQEIPDHSTFSKNRHGRFSSVGSVSGSVRRDRATLSGGGSGGRKESGGGWNDGGSQ